MKPINILIKLFLLIMTFSCKMEKKQASCLYIDLDLATHSSFHDVFDTIFIVPLETSKDAIVSKHGKFVSENNKFYIEDLNHEHVKIFTDHGKFVGKAGQYGKGPGEYSITQYKDFIIVDNNIQILTSRPPRILVYNESGEFLEALRLKNKAKLKSVRFFAKNDNSYYFYSSFSSNRLIRTDLKGQILDNMLGKIPEYIPRKTHLNPKRSVFSKGFEERIMFKEPFLNDIFEIKNGRLSTYLCWDFGDYNFNYMEDLEANKTKEYYAKSIKKSEYAYYPYFITENKKYIICSYIHKVLNKTIITNKQTGAYKVLKGFADYKIFPQPVFFSGDTLSFVCDITNLERYFVMNQLPVESRKVIESMGEYNNSLVIKLILKDF